MRWRAPWTSAPEYRREPQIRRRRWLALALVVLLFLLVGGALERSRRPAVGTAAQRQRAAYLPEGAEATSVLADTTRFSGAGVDRRHPRLHQAVRITDADRVQLTLIGVRIVGSLNQTLAGLPIGSTSPTTGSRPSSSCRSSAPTSTLCDPTSIQRMGRDLRSAGAPDCKA